jgi:Fur family zinc uptake transcriptional regulator
MGEACGHDHPFKGVEGSGLARALAAAEALCLRRGERLTAPRKRVLELLLRSGQPLKAYELIPVAGEDGGSVYPPTVYRALEFLLAQGLAHRIESLNAYVSCQQSDTGHAAAFLICECCGASSEIDTAAHLAIASQAMDLGFVVERQIIEARGRCKDCK